MRPFRNPIVCLLPLSSVLISIKAAVLSSSIGSTASPLVNASSFLDSAPNVNSLGAIDPAKFQIGTDYGERKLPATSVLMNAVDVMVQLALQDWDSQMGRKTFKLDIAKYSQIEIFISPWDNAAGATLRSGFAVLGLFEVILNILSDPVRRFRSVQSTFFYDGSKVGWLMMRHTTGISSVSASNMTKANPPTFPTFAEAAPNLDNTEPLDTMAGATVLEAPAWEDSHLKVTYGQYLDTFTIYEIFFTVIAYIRQMAVHSRTARVIDFTAIIDTPPITSAGQPIALSFRNYMNPPRTARNPPYFQWEWLIKAFGQLPQYMLDSRNFQEVVHMALKVDGVLVGEGYIVRKRTGLELVGGSTSDNVTTA